MNIKVARAFILAAFGLTIVNQGIIRYSWLQSTEGCSSGMVDWVASFHFLRNVSMGVLLLQVCYAWGIHYYSIQTTTMRLGNVLLSLINLIVLSTQMGNKSLVELSWTGCTEPFEDAYSYTDYCQAVALIVFVIACMVYHVIQPSQHKVKVVLPSPPSATLPSSGALGKDSVRKDSPLTWRGVIIIPK